LLNQNARKVNKSLVAKIKAQAPHADVFLTHTLEEAEKALTQVARGRYDLCFTGGGDGTVCHAVTRLSELTSSRGTPPIGVLLLGTGNAIASYLSSPTVEECIRAPYKARTDLLSFPELKVHQSGAASSGPKKAAFGGFGWDSFVLDRYFRWRDALKGSKLLKPFSEGLGAYFMSGLGWSVPALLLKRPRWEITVRNGDTEAYQLDQDGKVLKRIAAGELIYQGKVRLFSFGTCPYFGFKMKALPMAAAHPEMMQLRIADFSPLITAFSLPKIWKGTFKHKRLWDFLASDFTVTLSEDTAIQMGGDIVGRGKSFEVNMTKPAEVLRFGEYDGLKLIEERDVA
jgi:diacylglycerol kinase family enzyme